MAIANLSVALGGREHAEPHALASGAAAIDSGRDSRGDRFIKTRPRRDRIDEAPAYRAFTADALSQSREYVGQVAPNLALVNQARKPAGSRQDAEVGNLRQAHRRTAVIDQDNLLAG